MAAVVRAFRFCTVFEASARVKQETAAPSYFSALYPEFDYEKSEIKRRFNGNTQKIFKRVLLMLCRGSAYADNKFAGMAKSRPNIIIDPDQLSGLLEVDYGATTTLTDWLFNMTEVQPKSLTIQLVGEGATIQSQNIGKKTYYIPDVTGTVRPEITRAFYVKDLKHVRFGGRALTNSDHRVILGKNSAISAQFSEVYPVRAGTSKFRFLSGSHGLLYLKAVPVFVTSYAVICLDTVYCIEGLLMYQIALCS